MDQEQIIYLQIGNKDRITLKAFAIAVRNFLGILEDMDAAVFHADNGTVRWEVVFLQKNSPPVIGVRGVPVSKEYNSAPKQVRREVMNGVRALEKAARKPNVSDSVLSRMNLLAKQSRHTGSMELYTDQDKKGRIVEIGPELIEKIEQHIGRATESKGSIVGKLDTIAVHRSNEIRVWDENYGRAVRCEFKADLEEKVKSLLRHRVLVLGSIYFNTKGQPVSVAAEDVEPYPDSVDLPSIEEMSGLIDNLTGKQTLAEYMNELSNG
jgi:hypothetical protein